MRLSSAGGIITTSSPPKNKPLKSLGWLQGGLQFKSVLLYTAKRPAYISPKILVISQPIPKVFVGKGPDSRYSSFFQKTFAKFESFEHLFAIRSSSSLKHDTSLRLAEFRKSDQTIMFNLYLTKTVLVKFELFGFYS